MSSSEVQTSLRLNTAPAFVKVRDSEIQWLKDGSCSRPPTPHNTKRTRLRKGSAPMKPAVGYTDDQDLDDQAPSANHSNFPHLPSLVRAGSSKLSRKFSRRSSMSNSRGFSKLEDAALEFDKLESLTTVSISAPITNHHQYGASDDELGKKKSSSVRGRRFSSGVFDPTTQPTNSQSKSGILDFFRRSTPNYEQKGFDDLSITKSPLVKTENMRKKSEARAKMLMEPRSPRIGGSRDRHVTLPEIERLIKLSQKRRDTTSNASSTSSNRVPLTTADRSVTGRVKAMKIDK